MRGGGVANDAVIPRAGGESSTRRRLGSTCPSRNPGSPGPGAQLRTGRAMTVFVWCRHALAFPRRISPELCCRLAPDDCQRAQGRPGAGWHPSPYAQDAHGVDYRSRRSPGLPCTVGFNGVLRALPGERCTVAPVALRFDAARARSGRRIATRLDASLSGVRTTRLLRPRTARPYAPGPDVRTTDDQPGRCDNRRVVPRRA